MAAQKIRKGDTVVVLSGKDKGKTGEVLKSMPKDSKVVVAGVNVAVRHKKPTQVNPQGGLERIEIDHHRCAVVEAGLELLTDVLDAAYVESTEDPHAQAVIVHAVPAQPARRARCVGR